MKLAQLYKPLFGALHRQVNKYIYWVVVDDIHSYLGEWCWQQFPIADMKDLLK